MNEPQAPRARTSFAKLDQPLPLPNLIDIQKKSWEWFLSDGLAETIADINPIKDYSEKLLVQFGEHQFGQPIKSITECRNTDSTFSAPLNMKVAFINEETGEIREQSVFMGDFPMMTERGTFIIHGTERVVVTQLVRSPGAYIMEPKQAEREKQVLVANLMPQRGSWLELEIDKKGAVNVRIDRKRKFPVTVLLRAMGYGADDELLALFDDSVYIRNTIERDVTRSQDEALIELFRKQRPGEPPTLDGATAMLKGLFFDPKRYDLSRVGRHKLNVRLYTHLKPEDRPDADVRVLVNEDIVELIRRLISLPVSLGVPDDAKDYAAEANALLATRREEIASEIDEYEHFGNRRLRTVGELVQDAFRIGLARMERVIRERLTTEDPDTIVPATLVNIRPVVAALKEFFGSSQLSQFMDQTNSLSGLTHRRRLSALGAGGLTRERAPIEVRDVHPTHYGRMCPIETPEGPNIGLIGTLASMATVDEFGFVRVPYRRVVKGRVTDEIVYLDASEEEEKVIDQLTGEERYLIIAQANAPFDPETGELLGTSVLARAYPKSDVVAAHPEQIDYMDVSPTQIVSVATALIPFLEHDDANRALMGSNMQRQAVPLLQAEAPYVGTGMEFRAAVDTGDVVLARRAGKVVYVDADHIEVDVGKGEVDVYDLVKFMRSNQGTLIHQKPIVLPGDKVRAGAVLADGSSTDNGELALGRNLLVAFMSWEGFNFEDAIVLSEKVVKDDLLSSIHIEEYEVDARTTKLGDEEITRDIPNRSEESLKDLDERGIVRIGAEVNSGDLLVGKVTPKGETELTAEEKLIRAIFKEKAREVRDTSLKVPHGEGGKVIDVSVFSRENNDELPPSVNELVRVYVAKKRKIAEGDKLAGRHGNKGVIAKIVAEEDMPHLEDGTPVEVILNPLGVPSRMNIGQVLETHLGWAAHAGFQADGGRSKLPAYVASPVFDGATIEEVDELLIRSSEETPDNPVEFKVDRDEPAGRQCSGKVWLYDGRTGERFDNKVTIGYMYILKLLHLVDDKIHARSTGPYSLVTQQPLGGKAQFGGQRFGEMEVWALEAYGAAHVLQEMLTIKSDDTVGRVKAYEAIVKGENIAKPNIPESFKVLMKEIQSLALDMSVQSEEGDVLEVREEDDDLLRAAEELGIDLSAGRRRQQAEAGELEHAGADAAALRDIMGAGVEPAADVDVEPPADEEDSAEAAARDLMDVAASLSREADGFAREGDAIDLGDILDVDAADLEPDDAGSDED
ncbi:MAG TPA: DNA-directed RNA polymerase subunit beta [Thermoleophilia bacterium]|nr:DNA-directed RNA polymerase subunit beta [Thermoleophilia bacterium]